MLLAPLVVQYIATCEYLVFAVQSCVVGANPLVVVVASDSV